MTTISGKTDPVVRPVSFGDVAEALIAGLRDFQAEPLYGIALGAIYCVAGVAIVLSVTTLGMSYLAYPLAAGFALIGPFVATGFYEISRKRETGEAASFGDIWHAMTSRSEIGWMAFVTLFVFIMWMYQARFLMALFFGLNASFTSLSQFVAVVLGTNEGLIFLLVGNAVGAILALVLFSLTVVSFPLLLDRDVDCVTAMITSVRAVVRSPWPLIAWAGLIVVLLVVSALPLFLGLIVVLPVLGHASWHLYRRIIVPASSCAG
ncbi:DUF2189 domain-containing protein [Pseudorhodoplanes sp.]|uniref:DUF2189 domain-containing protein n=1 Tax=Pseudorhodoplanes sp. TaxID=1934341 RepID=UPI003D0AB64D